MLLNRRSFIKTAAGTAGAALMASACKTDQSVASETPISRLTPMTGDVVPVSDEERLQRIEKAQRLMVDSGLQALYLESGTSMFYFTGVRWGASERMFALIIPARGDMAWVCPKFEEDRAREVIRFGEDIRTWEEDKSPYQRVAEVFRDRGIRDGGIGIGERVRFFLYDGIRQAAPHLQYVSGDPISVECRVHKSPHEIALMQKANDITIAAYKASVAMWEKGMTRGDFSSIARRAFAALGVQGGIGAQIAEASSYPHGSIKRIELKEGDIILMDGGCGVDGYRSDISRTIVFGEPTERQKKIWSLAKKAQAAAFETAGPGVSCEAVDLAARRVYEEEGFGPGYKLPGLPHRTGHGIGLDGHEWIYLVIGNKRPMEPGMCFTNEPMIVIPGEFGVRLEDDFYVTGEGPKYFTQPSPSIDQPFA
jgi:Xaa-Pro dipeptidase